MSLHNFELQLVPILVFSVLSFRDYISYVEVTRNIFEKLFFRIFLNVRFFLTLEVESCNLKVRKLVEWCARNVSLCYETMEFIFYPQINL